MAAGLMGALASTINILVLDNPITFHFSQFLDSALGQIVGCFMAFIVILLIGDTLLPAYGRVAAEPVCVCGGIGDDHQYGASEQNHLPGLYQELS
ncbi:hypothetical protein ACNKHQ_18890 [Shigella flexneri]